MRWKILFAFVFIGGIAVAGAMGWGRLREIRRLKEVGQKLDLAKSQMEQGNHPRAQANLQAILDENPKLAQADAIWALLARSFETTGDADKALACWQKIQENYPDSEHVDNALAALAERAYDEGKHKAAADYWDTILTRYKGSDATPDAELGKARLSYHTDSPKAARAELLAWLDANPDSPRRAAAEEILGRINLEALYSSELDEGDLIYAIKKGDRLETVGKKFRVSPDLILRANNIRDVKLLTVGRRLKIAKTDFSILVNKSDNTLLLLNGGKFFKRYRVRTGKDDWRTPPGEFHILRKVKNPDWNNPEDGVTYRAGDPKNALGTRWMAFEGSMLGIHGTIDPSTIGQYASMGCVGMLTEDVEELYDLVPIGTPVKIIGKMTSRGKEKTF